MREKKAFLLLLGVCIAMIVFITRAGIVTVQSRTYQLAFFNTTSQSQSQIFMPPLLNKCELPSEGFRAWKDGVVTTLTPNFARNCPKLTSGDWKEIKRVTRNKKKWKNAVSDSSLFVKMQDCAWVRNYFGNNLYITEVERDFSIAFLFLVHDSPQQALRLLRLLYRPHNSYCIHVDAKSRYTEFFKSIANCLPNVIIPYRSEQVVWGYYTIMEAQIDCLTDLIRLRATQEHKWKYVINLCGKELPLMTNKEIVVRLKKLNGMSSIVARKVSRYDYEISSRNKYMISLDDEKKKIVVNKRIELKKKQPFFNMYKSMSYNALSYQFAYHLVFSRLAQRIHNYFRYCRSSEEHIYATLFMMPGIPGGYDPRVSKDIFEVENVFWMIPNRLKKKNIRCHGEVVHDICIITSADLHHVVARNYPFHNKYFMELDHTVMDCMEERIVSQNQLDYRRECM